MGPRWSYLINEVVTGLRRNLLMTVATVITVTVSLALLGAGLLVQVQVQKAQRILYGQIEVSIFLLDTIQSPELARLEADLDGNALVESVYYESKEQAFANFQEIFKEEPSVLEGVTPAVLPASFRVKLLDPEKFESVASQFRDYPGVEDVVDQRQILDKFFRVMNALRNGALAVAVLQLCAAAALISNTIRVTAFARREQTGIMKLVGATNWYIRLPFVLEGIVAGVAGAVVAGILLLIGEATLVSRLAVDVAFVPFIDASEVVAILPLLVLIGGGIASIASVLSLRRFLAV